MPGLIEQAVQKPQAAAQAPGAGAAPSNLNSVVQRLEIAAKKIIAVPEVSQRLLAMMQQAKDPVKGLAQATVFLIMQIGQKANGQIPGQALIPALKLIIIDVARLGARAELFKVDAQFILQAARAAIALMMPKGQQQGSQAAVTPGAVPPAVPGPAATAPAAAPSLGG